MDDELKGVMLERACDQNNSIMVECLLLLGADANRAKEGTSLICQVNFQDDTCFILLTLPLYNSYLHPIIPYYRICQFIAQLLVICNRSFVRGISEVIGSLGIVVEYFILLVYLLC